MYINHGGKFIDSGGCRFYIGGEFVGKHGFDTDTFSFFDFRDGILELGYQSWKGIYYKVPRTDVYKPISQYRDITEMLAHISAKCMSFQIFVDHGVENVGVDYGKEQGSFNADKEKGAIGGQGISIAHKGKCVEGVEGNSNNDNEKGKCIVEDDQSDDANDECEYSSEGEFEGIETVNEESDHGENIDDDIDIEGEDEEYIDVINNIRIEKERLAHADADAEPYVNNVGDDHLGSDSVNLFMYVKMKSWRIQVGQMVILSSGKCIGCSIILGVTIVRWK